MITSVLTVLGALLTILGPVVAAGLLAWLERKQSERTHESVDEADEHIRQHLSGNRAGLVNLSSQLERLKREVERKRRRS